MSEKPEALRLADGLETHVMFGSGRLISRPGLENIVTTLRRQHAEIERLKAERDEAVKAEREACVSIIEYYKIPVGNSRAGEVAFDWTWDALKEIRNSIRARGQEDKT